MTRVDENVIRSLRTTGNFSVDKLLDSKKMNSRISEHVDKNEEKIQLAKKQINSAVVGTLERENSYSNEVQLSTHHQGISDAGSVMSQFMENKEIVTKGLNSFLEEDSTLLEQRSNITIQTGVDDSSLEKAYDGYKKVLEEDPEITPKGYLGYLKEDPTLTEKRTLAELECIQAGIDDSSLEELYDGYKKVMAKINK